MCAYRRPHVILKGALFPDPLKSMTRNTSIAADTATI